MKSFSVFFLVTLILIAGCSNENDGEKLQISNSMISIGAVHAEQTNFEKQKLTYEIIIKNPLNIKIVDSIDIIPAKFIKDRLIKTKNKGIEYNKNTIKVDGQIIFDSRGLTKKEMANFEPHIKGVQFIGDNNKEYFLLNISNKDQLK